MEGKKNLCAMIPAELHARIMAEKEEWELNTLAEYVERIFAEHFEGGNSMKAERTLAVQIPAELFERLKEYLVAHNLKQMLRYPLLCQWVACHTSLATQHYQ